MGFQKVIHLDKGWETGIGAKRSDTIERQLHNGPPPPHIVEFRSKLKFFSPKEVADLLGMSVWTVYEIIKIGKLRSQPIGRIIRISSYDLAAYLEEQAG